jgi:hypothetical protein
MKKTFLRISIIFVVTFSIIGGLAGSIIGS